MGIRPDFFPFIVWPISIVCNGKSGYSQVPNLKRMRDDLFRLEDRFKFPEVTVYELKTTYLNDFGNKPTYFLPVGRKTQFIRDCRANKVIGGWDAEGNLILVESQPADYHYCYENWDLYHLFCTLYVIIADCAETMRDCFAAKPDPLLCWILFSNIIKNDVLIKALESDCEDMSNDDLGKDLDTFIRNIHDPQTTKEDSPKQVPIFKNSVPFPEKETNAMVDAFIDFIKNQPEAIRISYKNLIDGIQQALSKIIPPES